MAFKRLMTLALAALIICLLAACSNAGSSATTAPSATATTVDPTIALAQTFSGENLIGDTLTVNYPEGWFQAGNTDTVLLASSEALVTGTTATIPAGEAGVSIIAFRTAFAEDMVEGDLTPESLLAAYTETLRSEEASFSEPEAFTLNNRAAARTTGSDATSDGIILVIDLDTAYALLIGSTTKGELAPFEPTMQAILGSVTYTINPDTEIGDAETTE